MNIASIILPGLVPAAQPTPPLPATPLAMGNTPSFGLTLLAVAPSVPPTQPVMQPVMKPPMQPAMQRLPAQVSLLGGTALEAVGQEAPIAVAPPVPAAGLPSVPEAAVPSRPQEPGVTLTEQPAQSRIQVAETAQPAPEQLLAPPSAFPAPAPATPSDPSTAARVEVVTTPAEDEMPVDVAVEPALPEVAPAAPLVQATVPAARPMTETVALAPPEVRALGRGSSIEAPKTPESAAEPMGPTAPAIEAPVSPVRSEARPAAETVMRADAPIFERAALDAPAPGPAPAPAPLKTETASPPVVADAGIDPRVHDEPIVAARPGQLGRDMGVEIARRVSAGKDEVVVRLNPVELGRIEVRMTFDETGSLRAVMTTETSVAMDMLRRDAADLGRTLAEAGVRADLDSFRFANRGGDGAPGGWSGRGDDNSRRDGDRRNDERGHRSADDSADDVAYRPVRADGLIDLIA